VKIKATDQREQGFYLFLMISAYASTLTFGLYYYFVGAYIIAYSTGVAFTLFCFYGLISFIYPNLVLLFRLSIITALAAFFIQVMYTGGIYSSSMGEFIIIPLLAFFYRPKSDRYYFLVIAACCMLVMWPLTKMGIAQNILNSQDRMTNSLMANVFMFSIVTVYTFLFRYALVVKNKKLGASMIELKETTQKLIQSEKMASLGIMSAGVAHEINNPLNFIKGGIEVLDEELKKEKNLTMDHEPCIHVVKEGVTRAAAIVNSLSHFSRQTDSMDEPCDLHAILDNCLVMLQQKLKYKAELIKKYSTESVLIRGNEGKLHQAFLNFLSNSEQAIENKGIVTIETTVSKKSISVSISDTGIGISQENLKKISDPFFTTKPIGKGTGLGLTITYRIIEEHGGTISVTSKAGKGTKFTVDFNT
jgi:signal transduction histidine kinase